MQLKTKILFGLISGVSVLGLGLGIGLPLGLNHTSAIKQAQYNSASSSASQSNAPLSLYFPSHDENSAPHINKAFYHQNESTNNLVLNPYIKPNSPLQDYQNASYITSFTNNELTMTYHLNGYAAYDVDSKPVPTPSEIQNVTLAYVNINWFNENYHINSVANGTLPSTTWTSQQILNNNSAKGLNIKTFLTENNQNVIPLSTSTINKELNYVFQFNLNHLNNVTNNQPFYLMVLYTLNNNLEMMGNNAWVLE